MVLDMNLDPKLRGGLYPPPPIPMGVYWTPMESDGLRWTPMRPEMAQRQANICSITGLYSHVFAHFCS
jgi:hypothetical protein